MKKSLVFSCCLALGYMGSAFAQYCDSVYITVPSSGFNRWDFTNFKCTDLNGKECKVTPTQVDYVQKLEVCSDNSYKSISETPLKALSEYFAQGDDIAKVRIGGTPQELRYAITFNLVGHAVGPNRNNITYDFGRVALAEGYSNIWKNNWYLYTNKYDNIFPAQYKADKVYVDFSGNHNSTNVCSYKSDDGEFACFQFGIKKSFLRYNQFEITKI